MLAGADPGWTLGEALVEAGEAERGHAVLLDAVGGIEAVRVAPVDRPLAWERLAHAALETGDPAAARAYAERAHAAAARLERLDAPTAAAGRALAAVLVAEGRAAEAVAVVEAAIADMAGAAALEAPRLELALGRALAAAGGRRKRAVATLLAAEAGLARLGAEHWRAQAVRELRRLGHRVARAAARGRRGRRRGPDRARARGRPARPRPSHEQGDRAAPLPQREDGRGAPAQHLRQAPRVLARRRRPRDRASGRGGRRLDGARLSPGGFVRRRRHEQRRARRGRAAGRARALVMGLASAPQKRAGRARPLHRWTPLILTLIGVGDTQGRGADRGDRAGGGGRGDRPRPA